MTHQVVKKDVRGLGWQISNVEQELPKHVHQLVLVQKPNKWTNNKKLIASLFPHICPQVFAYLSVANCQLFQEVAENESWIFNEAVPEDLLGNSTH